MRIGIINDGHRKFANLHGLPLAASYWEGAKRGFNFINWSSQYTDYGINEITAFVSSQENVSKRTTEVISIIHRAGIKFIKRLYEYDGIDVQVVGDFSYFPTEVQDFLARCAEQPKLKDSKLQVNLLINYSGHWDLVQAARVAVVDSQQERLENLDQKTYRSLLPSACIGDFDLVIRTGDRHCLSGYPPWQSNYAELLIFNKLWPEFSEEMFHQAMQWYYQQDRRHGA